MSEVRYKVSASAEVTNELMKLIDRARQLGILDEFYDAGIWIQSELKSTPLEFGEARYVHLDENRLQLRCATIRPLHVEFAVHEASHNVFIRRYALVKL
jgi:hypothetical protein